MDFFKNIFTKKEQTTKTMAPPKTREPSNIGMTMDNGSTLKQNPKNINTDILFLKILSIVSIHLNGL